jgi:hypothetical protein
MIDDMAGLKKALEQMDAEDPVVAQAAKDRAAQTLSDAKLSFSKMAELIEQRRLLLRPRIVASIKRMDQPGMLGDAAFRDAGSALRREGQTFGQIAEAIERTGSPTSEYGDPVRNSEPLEQMASEPDAPAWRRALGVVTRVVLRHRILSLAIALLAILLSYALPGFVSPGQQVAKYVDGIAAVRRSTDQAISSVSSFIHERILPQSREATAPPTPPAPIPSPPDAALSPPSATPSAASPTASATPATAPAPSAGTSAPPAPPSAAPAPPSAAPADRPASTPRRDARGAPPAKSATNCAAGREDRYPCSRRSTPFENDRPSAVEDVIPERIRRKSHMAGPCIHGVGGCAWGGRQY